MNTELKKEVNIKDREPKVEYLPMALAMAEFGVSYEYADLINEVTNKVKLMGGKFSTEDGVKVFFEWKKKWEQYHAERGDEKVVSGMLPTDEEIINEAEGRYPVKTHNNPDDSPYVGTQKTFIHGVRWALAFVQGNYR